MEHWLDSLPSDLRDAIACAETQIRSALDTFRSDISLVISEPPPLPIGVSVDFGDPYHLDPQDLAPRYLWLRHLLWIGRGKKGRRFPLLELLDTIQETSVALEWNIHFRKGPPDILFFEISQLCAQIRFAGVNSSSSKREELSIPCTTIMSCALSAAPPFTFWRCLFGIFLPPTRPTTPPSGATSTASSQTPVKANSGSRLNQSTTHRAVDPLLRAELDHLVFPDTEGFLEAFFREQKDAFVSSQLCRFKNGVWSGWPSPPVQNRVLNWFCNLINPLIKTGGCQYCISPNTRLGGSDADRKPDLFLCQGSILAAQDFSWESVLVVCEIKESHPPGASVDLVIEVANYVRLIFYAQSARRFVHAFTLCGEFGRCWIFHRGGAMGSVAFSINQNPQRFIDVVVGYAKMTREDLGFDTTINFDDFHMPGIQQTFQVDQLPFFHRQAIASRATTCWRAVQVPKIEQNNPITYVLKDSWRSVKHCSEAALLQKAQGRQVRGIVQALAYQDVVFGDTLDDILGNVMKGLEVKRCMTLDYPPPTYVKQYTESNYSARRSSSTTPAFPTAIAASTGSEGRYSQATMRLTRSASARVSLEQGANATDRARSRSVPSGKPVKTSTGSTEYPPSPKTSRSSGAKRRATGDSSSQPKRRRSLAVTELPVFNRVHTRILMIEGRPIYEFRSRFELIQGFHDAIIGHRSLLKEGGILHRDISINNIVLAQLGHPRVDGLTGFLIDLDMAVEAGSEPSGAPHRTGTMEFMAIGALLDEVHTYRHDLESFFYVFLWICCSYEILSRGKNREMRVRVLERWANGKYHEAAGVKILNMRPGSPTNGFETILKVFSNWADGLKELAEDWRGLLFPIHDEYGRLLDPNANIFVGTVEDEAPLYDKILKLLENKAKGLRKQDAIE